MPNPIVQPTDLAALYQEKIDQGQVLPDLLQANIVQQLTGLEAKLAKWQPTRARGLFGGPPVPAPMGIYLYGGVGRGKSMLMDLFFEAAPIDNKRRIHFHAFMQEVHAQIAQWRSLTPRARKSHPHHVKGAGDDPLAPVAKGIAQNARLLCFDEFQVSDIADAMILGRLFDHLWRHQIVVVATSNRHPRDLYHNGLNRALFLPFIDILEDHMTLIALDGPRDYRLARLDGRDHYLCPLDGAAFTAMDQMWDALTLDMRPQAETLTHAGRTLTIGRAAGTFARIGFEDWCDKALGAGDYLALAQRYDTVFLDGVPMMGPHNRSAAARFRLLLDALYENKVRLVVSAQAQPDRLYPQGDQAFEFERTASRLYEMRSQTYLAAACGSGGKS
jgi:cell division protein ZapE